MIRLVSPRSECYDCNVRTARTRFQRLGRFQIVNTPWRSACTRTGLCVNSHIAPMSHNCFASFQGHPLPALFCTIWDRLEVSSLFLSASKSSQYGGPAQNDMISTFEQSRLDTSGSHGDVTVAHLGLSWDTNRLLPYSAGVFAADLLLSCNQHYHARLSWRLLM